VLRNGYLSLGFGLILRYNLSNGTDHQGIDQIPADPFKAGLSTISCEIHRLINSVWNKEELPEQWKRSLIVPIYKKGDKTSYNNYRSIPRLSNKYKNLSNILLSKLTPYAEEIIKGNQCWFRLNRSITDHIFCIRQMLEKEE
jgi:hypothetical protein